MLNHAILLGGNVNVDYVYDWDACTTEFLRHLVKSSDLYYEVDYRSYCTKGLNEHIVDLICKLCGVEPQPRTLDFYLSEEEKRFGYQFVEAIKLRTGRKHVVGIHPNASTPNREWPLSNWNQLVYSLRSSIAFVQLSAAGDPRVSGTAGINHMFGIREVAAVVRYSDAIIANDSWINHAAAAVSTPGVVLFGASSPIVFGHILHHNLVGVRMECAPCYRPALWAGDFSIDYLKRLIPWECSHRLCLRSISVETVKTALLNLLSTL